MATNFTWINRQEQFGFVTYDVIAAGDFNGRFTNKLKSAQDNAPTRLTLAQNTAAYLLSESIRSAKRSLVTTEVINTLNLAYGILINKTLTNAQINNLVSNLDTVLTALGLSDLVGIKPPAYNKLKDSFTAISNYISSDKATLQQLTNIEDMANDMISKLSTL